VPTRRAGPDVHVARPFATSVGGFNAIRIGQLHCSRGTRMDGNRIRNYWSGEIDALVRTYKQFETLVPAPDREGAQHSGEDGRFVEDLLPTVLSTFPIW